jgi:iron complex transport system substrate-binding protein
MKNETRMVILVPILLALFFSSSPTISAQDTVRTITDEAGRGVAIPAQINRLIATVPWMLSITSAINGRDKVVAITTEATKDYGFNTLFPEWIKQTPVVGSFNELNLETTLKVNPQLIISQPGKIVEQMQTVAIPVVVVTREKEIPENIRFIGAVIGREKEAEALASYYVRKMDLVKSRVASQPDRTPKKIYFVAGPNPLQTIGKDFGNEPLIRAAGGRLVTDKVKGSTGITVSAEQLLQWNPDIIVVGYGWGLKPEDILKDPKWQELSAVRTKSVFLEPPPHAACLKKHPSACLGTLWLAQKIAPDLFNDVNIRQEAEIFIKEFYRVSWKADFI